MENFNSLFIALAALLWSSDSLFRFSLLKDLSPWAIVLGEHVLALVFVGPILWRERMALLILNKKQWGSLIFIGVGASALATLAFTTSFSYIGPSVAILLQKTQPFFTFILAWWWLKETLPKKFGWWAGLAIVGAYLVSFPEIIPQFSLYQNGGWGIILALVAAALWGSATVFGRTLVNTLPYPLVTALRFIIALPVLVVLLFVYGGGISAYSGLSIQDLLYLIIIMLGPGWGAMYLYYKGLKFTRASVSAILELTWPVAAVILNWIFLDEKLMWLQIVGGLALILAASKLTVWKKD